jgi:nucleoside transporter
MKPAIRIQLSLMMFLEFFIWGAWFVTLGTFLGKNLAATGLQAANVFSTQSYGAIIAPFIIGLIADKFFNAERILGVLHLVGACMMYKMYSTNDINVFFPFTFAYMVAYMPTLALVNSVAFRQIQNPEKEFSSLRVWGTIGWIVAGLSISYLFHWDSDESVSQGLLKNTFAMAGIASLLLGLFSFTLPKTPPAGKGAKTSVSQILGLDALKLLGNKNFFIFFIASIMICIPLAFYYQNANPFLQSIGLPNPTGKMAIGQVSEALCILLIPFFFSKFGFKKTIMMGMLAWALRYVMFAYGNADSLSWVLILGIALHGICYDFFFVAGQIYTDQKAGAEIRSAAQGMITLATYGAGMWIGFYIAGLITDKYQTAGTHDWHTIWLIPAAIAAAVLIFFLVFFRNDKKVSFSEETVKMH